MLGIKASPVPDHQNHFHIYLNPPAPKVLDPALLLADNSLATATDSATPTITLQTEAQGLLDYAQSIIDTGEEIMFTMDIPYVPVQDTAIVLVQAAVPGTGVAPPVASARQPDYLLKTCKEFSSGGAG